MFLFVCSVEVKWVWGRLYQAWGDQQTSSGLRAFLQATMDKQRSAIAAQSGPVTMWAAMAELTPTLFDVMFNMRGSLRQMADSVNRALTVWFAALWWANANIVATDFFMGNNLVDVAISANLRKVNNIDN